MSSAAIYYFFTVLILSLGSLLTLPKALNTGIIFLTLFFVFAGSQFNGADWINYTNVYAQLADTAWADVLLNPPFEILFSLLAKFYASNDIEYQFFIASIALFDLCMIFYLAHKLQVKNIFLFSLILFLLQGWTLFQEQIRQSVAVVICLFSVYQYLQLNKKMAYFWILIAMGFHASAVFGFFYIYVAGIVIKNDGMPLTNRHFGTVTIFFVALIGVLIATVKLLPFGAILSGLWLQKLDYYINDESASSSLLNLGLLAYLIGFLLLMDLRKYVVFYNFRWLSFAWSMAMLWCLICPFLRLIAIFTRFEHYFMILIPFAFVSYEYRNQKLFVKSGIRNIIYASFALTFTVRLLFQPAQSVWVNDYQNIFVNFLFDEQAEQLDLRKERVCNELLDSGNDFCGILNQ